MGTAESSARTPSTSTATTAAPGGQVGKFPNRACWDGGSGKISDASSGASSGGGVAA
jgi:hypothetical protein